MKDRSVRRHTEQVKKQKAKRILFDVRGQRDWIVGLGEHLANRVIGIKGDTFSDCNCYHCRNPRRNPWADHAETRQEIKAKLKQKDFD
jgi:hypothetical protein